MPEAIWDDPVLQQTYTHRVPVDSNRPSPGPELRESVLDVQGMHCAACADIIESRLSHMPGVSHACVSAAAQRLTVRWNPSLTQLSTVVQQVEAAGYSLSPSTRAHAQEMRREEARMALWRLFVAAFCAMQVMMLATPSYVAHEGDLALDLRQLLNWGQWLMSLPVMVFSAGPLLRTALTAVRLRHVSMEVPAALGVLVMFGVSSAVTFHPGGVFGSEVYFDSLTMFLSFLLTARWLEMRSRHQSARVMEGLLQERPQTAWLLDEDDQVREVALEQVRVGDRIRVPMGMCIGVDGLVLRGSTKVSESLMTGEHEPVSRGPGQLVLAGSLNQQSPIDVCATRVGQDTRLQQLVRLAEEASLQRPHVVELADRWAAPFLWGVMASATMAAGLWSLIDPNKAVWVFVSVLIVTCPCALSLAVPSALLAGARAMARRGVLLQRLGAIEDMARVDTVLFDKTGTLTQEGLRGKRVELMRDADPALRFVKFSPSSVLQQAASLARWSAHPVSSALVSYAREGSNALEPETAWREVQEFSGLGLQARDEHGRTWRLGRPDWVSAPSVQIPSDSAPQDAQVTVAWGTEGRIVARFMFSEALRSSALPALERLRSMNIQARVLSGDTTPRVVAIARDLGLPIQGSAALPDQKLAHLHSLQKQGHVVAMVGDGVNDAPSLAQAQVSFAMGHGSAASVARADAVVLSGNLEQIPQSLSAARRTLRIIRQNLVWAVFYNLLSIPMALAGYLPPWAAGLGMALSSLFVVLNSHRALNEHPTKSVPKWEPIARVRA